MSYSREKVPYKKKKRKLSIKNEKKGDKNARRSMNEDWGRLRPLQEA
jgi:hypothetical protein